MVIIRSLGVETDASRAVNEVPTPTGVACQSQADVFFHRGFINGFFVYVISSRYWKIHSLGGYGIGYDA